VIDKITIIVGLVSMGVSRRVLIDEWFPIGEVSIESVRERSASSALPPLYFLHVWFARRPLATSRASILFSLLSSEAERDEVLPILGIPHNRDVVGAAKLLERAKSEGKRLKKNPFEWKRAYTHTPTKNETKWLHDELSKNWGKFPVILDPMAGGGSIPFESVRLGLPTIAGDLNPVAYMILKATVEYPAKYGARLLPAVEEFCSNVHKAAVTELEEYFLNEKGEQIYRYLWSRTISCPSCGLSIPMSPNWWIVRGGGGSKEVAVKLEIPEEDEGDVCGFEMVRNPRASGYDPYDGTDVRKEAICPRCGRVVDSDAVKVEAQSGKMGHQLYCINSKRKEGKRGRWIFRTPTSLDLGAAEKAEKRLQEKLPEWEKQGLVPTEKYPEEAGDSRPIRYGMPRWCDMYNPRQLLSHLTYLEKLLEEKRRIISVAGNDEDRGFAEAVVTYAGIVFDSCISYNNILTRWRADRQVITGSMDMQAFPFKTSYAEAEHSETLWPWAQQKTLDSLSELIEYLPEDPGNVKIFCGDSASIPLGDESVECIVVDPPYHANVMYAEVSDFFYVWLKRIVGDIYPDAFRDVLTEKREEAVANIALFREAGKRGVAKRLATRHYEAKMEACFRDMRRVLKDDGVMTVMFTHRESEAWASLATALINAGFTFTASWPVFTEPSRKFGKTGKGVLKATVLLCCRKQSEERRGLWEQVIRELYQAAEEKVKEHAELGITGPDLLVSVYGPVLGKFADYGLVKDATGNVKNPGDALTIVAEVVNRHLTADLPATDLDTIAYLNLIREFPGLEADYDLARLTTVFGGNVTVDNLDVKVGRGLIRKKGGKVEILTAHQRVEEGVINPNNAEGLMSLIDVVHASMVAYEQRGLIAVTELLQRTGRDTADSGYIAVLRVLAQAGSGEDSAKDLSSEAGTVKSLLEALGHRPEVTRRKGESLMDYVREE